MKTNRYTAGFIYPALLLTLFLVCFVFLPAVSKENDRVNYLTAIMPNMIDYITEITDLKYKGYPLPNIVIENEKQTKQRIYTSRNSDNCRDYWNS